MISSSSIPYALGALVLYGLADFVYKRGAAAGALPHQFLMVQTWFFSPLALIYGLTSGTLSFTTGAVWGAAAGVLVVIGYYNFAWSLRHGAVSTNATIFRLSFIVTSALAVLVLGEALTAAKIAGMALALFAVWLLVAAPVTGNAEANQQRNALATTFAAYVDRGIRLSRAALMHAPISATLLVVAFTFLAKGLERGDASVVVPIAQMGFVVSAFLGFIFLRERLTARRLGGLAVALLALGTLAWAA